MKKKRFYYKDIIPIKRNNLIKINYNNKQNLVPLKKDLNNHNWTINKEGSIEVFTDGSCSNNIESKHAGYGVFFEDNHPLNYSGNCVGIHNSFNGELSSILYALKNTPYDKNLKIITDSLSAIQLIDKIQFHLKNDLHYKLKFDFRWITSEIIKYIKIRYDHNSTIELNHIYSHSITKENINQDLKLKIVKQKVLYKDKFEKYTKGNDNADKLAKIGTINDNKFNLPYCKDKYFLINPNKQIIYKKIQNYLTKSEHHKISNNYHTRLFEKWNIPSNLIHDSSFNFNKKIHWKNIQAIDFLIKIRAKDLKLKDKIFEQLNNAKEYNIDSK